MEKQNNSIIDRASLTSRLGITLTKVKKNDATLSEKAQVMKIVNDKMHQLLCKDFSQYYKHISADILVKGKDGGYQLKNVNGYFLLFEKECQLKDKNGKTITQKGYSICKPTTYVKGANSMECLYYSVIGSTTIKN